MARDFSPKHCQSSGQVMNRVDSATIVSHDDGKRVMQQMIYKFKP